MQTCVLHCRFFCLFSAAPQQLPHFFATEQEEQQQLVVACQRILVRGLAAASLLNSVTVYISCNNWCQGCKQQLLVACQRILVRGCAAPLACTFLCHNLLVSAVMAEDDYKRLGSGFGCVAVLNVVMLLNSGVAAT
jgi:hypothetical protein